MATVKSVAPVRKKVTMLCVSSAKEVLYRECVLTIVCVK